MALGETLKNYVVGIGIKDNNFTQSIRQFGSGIKSLIAEFGMLAGAGGIGIALKQFADFGNSLVNFSGMTGIAIEDISTLGAALERFGGNTENAKSSLQSLQQGLSQAEWGQGDMLQTAAMYGVNIFNNDGSIKNAKQLLMGLADDFTHLTKAQSFSLGQKLGLDESTIQLLQQGKSNVNAILNDVSNTGVINAQQAQAAKQFALELNKLKREFGSIARILVSAIMPILKDLAKALSKALNFIKSLDTYTIVLASSFVTLGWGIKNLQSIVITFGKVFTKSNLPLLALIAGLTLLFLLIEDIYSWTQGKESLFGRMLENEKFQKFISFFKNIGSFFKNMFGGASEWISEMVGKLQTVFDIMGYYFSHIGALFKKEIFETINAISDKLGGFLGKVGIKIQKFDVPEVKSLEQHLAEKKQERASLQQTNTVTVNIKGTGDNISDVMNAAEAGMNKAIQTPPDAALIY